MAAPTLQEINNIRSELNVLSNQSGLSWNELRLVMAYLFAQNGSGGSGGTGGATTIADGADATQGAIADAATTAGAAGTLSAKLRLVTSQLDRLPNSAWFRLQNAADLARAFVYLGAGTIDERVSTITYTSASLGIAATETFTYEGSPGAYRISAIARTQA